MGPKLDYNKGVAQKFNHPICIYMYVPESIHIRKTMKLPV